MKKIFIKIAGVFFLLLGIAGLFLPVLQGWLFIFIGLSLLSPPLAARVRRGIFLRFAKGPVLPLDEWRPLGVHAGFTTRIFPVHLASTDDLDREDARAAVRLTALADSRAPKPERFAYLKQVHGNLAVRVDRAHFRIGDFLRVPDADALVTADRRTALLVLSADCLPIFYAALRDGKTVAVALAHAGWRGTKENLAVRTLEKLKEVSGAQNADIRVAFGPSIDAAHYEVGAEFRSRFPQASLREKDARLYFDLPGENKRQLIEAGVSRGHILDTGLSTVAHNRFFYSFRLEKAAAGRTVSTVFMS